MREPGGDKGTRLVSIQLVLGPGTKRAKRGLGRRKAAFGERNEHENKFYIPTTHSYFTSYPNKIKS